MVCYALPVALFVHVRTIIDESVDIRRMLAVMPITTLVIRGDLPITEEQFSYPKILSVKARAVEYTLVIR